MIAEVITKKYLSVFLWRHLQQINITLLTILRQIVECKNGLLTNQNKRLLFVMILNSMKTLPLLNFWEKPNAFAWEKPVSSG